MQTTKMAGKATNRIMVKVVFMSFSRKSPSYCVALNVGIFTWSIDWIHSDWYKPASLLDYELGALFLAFHGREKSFHVKAGSKTDRKLF